MGIRKARSGVIDAGFDWRFLMEWGPFWTGANAVHGIVLVHLPQYWAELTLDCEGDREAESAFLEDFPFTMEHELWHILIGREERVSIEVEHDIIEKLIGRGLNTS